MKHVLLAVLSLSSISSFSQNKLPAASEPKVVYGTDDRKEVKDVTNQLYLRLAESTASMFPSANLVPDGFDRYQIKAETLQTAMQVCATEKYSQQLAGAMCSGFLVGPDLLLTAGHCIEDQNGCNENKWVFDYYEHLININNKSVDADNVYRCKSIVSRALDPVTMLDYALIKLDRTVTNRTPLKYRTSGKIADNASLVVIGNPSGLPTKITDHGNVRLNTNPIFFNSNLDTFGGNSGSAVFDANTGIVEGILVRGEEDYVPDMIRQCRKVNYVALDGGRGEDITRITNVSGLAGIAAPTTVAAPSTTTTTINIRTLLGSWRQSINANKILKLQEQNGRLMAITSGFTAGVSTTSAIMSDMEGDLSIDFMPSKGCKMFLKPVSTNKIYFAYCSKKYTAEAYFTR